MTRIAVLRCEKLPSFVTWEIPNPDELFEEDKLLIRGFQAQRFDAQPVVWNDPTIDWNQFDIALIRSTWDYLDEREKFLQVLLRANQPQREYLIQPFIENIVIEGEWSFIYFNGQLSHVFLKTPAAKDYRIQGIYGGTLQRVEPPSQDLLQAEAVLAKLPFDLLYARLDFVRAGNQLSVVEVELIEPIFDFNLVPESVARFVNATRVKFEMQK